MKYEQQQWLHRVWSKQWKHQKKRILAVTLAPCQCGIVYLTQIWFRFRNRSHQFAALRVSSIRKDKHTKIARVIHCDCCIFHVLKKRSVKFNNDSKKDTIICISAPEIFDRVLVELSARAHVQYPLAEKCGVILPACHLYQGFLSPCACASETFTLLVRAHWNYCMTRLVCTGNSIYFGIKGTIQHIGKCTYSLS